MGKLVMDGNRIDCHNRYWGIFHNRWIFRSSYLEVPSFDCASNCGLVNDCWFNNRICNGFKEINNLFFFNFLKKNEKQIKRYDNMGNRNNTHLIIGSQRIRSNIMKKAKITIEGNKGAYKVFVEDRYGKTLHSGAKWKTKKEAMKELKRARKWVKY